MFFSRAVTRSVTNAVQFRLFSLMSKTPMVGSMPITSAFKNNLSSEIQPISAFSLVSNLLQRRFKSRGNTYQPSTLKRKRTFGFLARLRSRNGKKILNRRRAKGRWYLTH